MQASNGIPAIRRNDGKSASCPVTVGLLCGSGSPEADQLPLASLAVRQPSVTWLTIRCQLADTWLPATAPTRRSLYRARLRPTPVRPLTGLMSALGHGPGFDAAQ